MGRGYLKFLSQLLGTDDLGSLFQKQTEYADVLRKPSYDNLRYVGRSRGPGLRANRHYRLRPVASRTHRRWSPRGEKMSLQSLGAIALVQTWARARIIYNGNLG